tara:strand:+ start:640 stop:1092 length:453 start_codon:yes stop_codon:yes gene_type:complete
MIEFRRSVIPDIAYIVDDIRKGDYEEIKALGSDPTEALYHGLVHSEAMTVTEDDHPVVIYGVVQEDTGGRIWLIGNNRLNKLSVRFCKESRQRVQDYLEEYKYLYNIVDSRNVATIKWLRWLGFVIGREFTYGPEGQLFKEFYQCQYLKH